MMLDMELHGRVELEWRGNILVVIPKGPFNLEGVTQSLNEIKAAVNSSQSKNWCRLVFHDEASIGPPEVIDAVRENYLWCLANGCQAIAIVSPGLLQRQLFGHDLPTVRAFDNEAEALQWLDQYGCG